MVLMYTRKISYGSASSEKLKRKILQPALKFVLNRHKSHTAHYVDLLHIYINLSWFREFVIQQLVIRRKCTCSMFNVLYSVNANNKMISYKQIGSNIIDFERLFVVKNRKKVEIKLNN